MSQPQSGILPEPSESALFLKMRVRDRARDGARVARAAARVPAQSAAIAKREPRRRLVSVLSFGPALCDVVSPAKRPDLCFALALALRRELGDAVEVLEEVHGFRYLDGRDLTGFIDGTENPKGRARAEAALSGAELEILRRSMPYGSTSEHGLEDRLMEFTQAVSGANFFAPSLALMRRIASK